MAKASRALPYIQQLLEDEFVQEQLQTAVSGARAAYLQGRRQRGKAVEDKRLYRNLRQAATGLQQATNALKRQKPEPKRRGRKLATVALAMGATAFIAMKLQGQYSQGEAKSEMRSPAPADAGAAAAGPRVAPPAAAIK